MPDERRRAAASSASPTSSPGMKRETARRTNSRRIARSRSQRLCEAASSALRRSPI